MKHGHEVSLAKPRRKRSGRGLAKLRTAHAVVGRRRTKALRRRFGRVRRSMCRVAGSAPDAAPRETERMRVASFSGMYIPVKKTFARERLERGGCGKFKHFAGRTVLARSLL